MRASNTLLYVPFGVTDHLTILWLHDPFGLTDLKVILLTTLSTWPFWNDI